jgi:hypothetical protein
VEQSQHERAKTVPGLVSFVLWPQDNPTLAPHSDMQDLSHLLQVAEDDADKGLFWEGIPFLDYLEPG